MSNIDVEAPSEAFLRKQELAQIKIKELIEGIRNNVVTRAFFTCNDNDYERPTLDNLRELAEALAENTSLKDIWFNNNKIGDEGMRILAPALARHTTICSVGFLNNDLTDDGIKVMVENLRGHPSLFELSLSCNPSITAEGVAACGTLLEENPELCRLDFGNYEPEDPDKDPLLHRYVELSDKAFAIGNKSLLQIRPEVFPTTAFCIRNRKAANQALKSLFELPIRALTEEISLATILRAAMRLPAIRHLADAETPSLTVAKFERFLESFPNVDLDAGYDWESLTTRDENELAPLDIPSIGLRFPEIMAELEARETPITKDQLMQKNGKGEPYLITHIISADGEDVISPMIAQGGYLTPDDLLEDGKPNALLNVLIEEDAIRKLFTMDNWRGQGAHAMLRVYRALPDPAKEQVHGIQTLTARLGRAPAPKMEI